MIRLILILPLLAACTPLDLIKSVVTPSKGLEVETDLTVGDKKEVVETVVTARKKTTSTTNTNTADTINQDITNITEAPPKNYWDLVTLLGIAFAIGVYLFPSGRQQFKMFKGLFKR